LIDFVRCYVNVNKIATHVTFNKKYKYIKLKNIIIFKNRKKKMKGVAVQQVACELVACELAATSMGWGGPKRKS
jgi:hypothetical protein